MGRPCGEIAFAMSQCHADARGLGGKCVCVVPCHCGSAKHAGVNARPRGVSLVSGVIGPTRVSHDTVPQECPTRVPYKSVLQECPTRAYYKSDPQQCPTRVSHKSLLQE